MADHAVRGAADLAVPGGASHPSGFEKWRRRGATPAAVAVPDVGSGHRAVLWRRAYLGAAHTPVDRRILALVGGAPVGGRLFRSVRDYRHRFLLHPAGADSAGAGGE